MLSLIRGGFNPLNAGAEALVLDDDNGPYAIQPSEGVKNGSTIEMAKEDKTSAFQHWTLYKNPNGSFKIQNAGSGCFMYIDAQSDELVQTGVFDGDDFEIDLLSQEKKVNENGTRAYYFGYADAWMKDIPDDALLSSVNIPGTHDMGTAHTDMTAGNTSARDQKNYVEEQLNMGVRYFDLRAYTNDENATPEKVTINHGATCIDRDGKKLTLQRVWDQMIQFLWENPTETIILSVGTDKGSIFDAFSDLKEAGVYHAMSELVSADRNYRDYIWEGDMIPTMGECRGKIILWHSYSVDEDDPDAIWHGLDKTAGGADAEDKNGDPIYYAMPSYTHSLNYAPIEVDGEKQRVCTYIQHEFQTSTDNKWKYFTTTLNQSAGLDTTYPYGDRLLYLINTTNTTGPTPLGDTLNTSRRINKKIYANTETNQNGDPYFSHYFTGIVTFNYVDGPLTRTVYKTNFASGADFFVREDIVVECPDAVDVQMDASTGRPIPQRPVKVYREMNGEKVELVEGTDYEIEYTYNDYPGKAMYEIKGIGQYTGRINKTGYFTINPLDADVYFTESPTKIYDGQPVTDPGIVTNSDGQVVYYYYDEYSPDIAQDRKFIDRVGKYKVKVIVGESTTGYGILTAEQDFYILPREVAVTLDVEKKGAAAGGGYAVDLIPTIYGSVDGAIGGEFTVEIDPGQEGSQTYTHYFAGEDCSVLEDGGIKLDKKPIGVDLSAGPHVITILYSEKIDSLYVKPSYYSKKTEVTYDPSARTINGTSSHNVTYSDNMNTVKLGLTASEPKSTDVWSYEIISDPYKELGFAETATVNGSGEVTIKNAGMVVINATLTDPTNEYQSCSKQVTVKVNQANLTVTSHAYKDGEEVDLCEYGQLEGLSYKLTSSIEGVDVTNDTFTNGHGYLETKALPYTANAGDQTIEIVKQGTGSITYDGKTYDDVFLSRNYNITYDPGTLTVTQVHLTVTADNVTGAYHEKAPEYTYQIDGLLPWDRPENVFDGDISVAIKGDKTFGELPPGSYDLVVTAKLRDISNDSSDVTSNYDLGTKDGTLTITKGDPQLSVESGVNEKFYDGTSNGTSKVDAKITKVEGFDGEVSLSWQRLNPDTEKFVSMIGSPVDAGVYRLVAETQETNLYKAATSSDMVFILRAPQGEPEIETPELTCNGEEQVLGKVTPGDNGDKVYYSLGEPVDADNYASYPTTPPTASDAGRYQVYYYVAPSENNYRPNEGVYRVNIDPEDVQWLLGENQTWTKGSGENLTFKTSAPFKTFRAVLVNDTELAADQYSVSEGSTIVTLKASYLQSLAPGTYKLTIRSQSVNLGTTFKIIGSGSDADTGDNTQVFPWIFAALAALIGISVSVTFIAKDKRRRN